jgi:hypothetical protein
MISKLKSDDYLSLPIMFLSLRDFVPPNVAITSTNISLANGSGNTNVSGAIKMVELLGVVVQGHPLICGVHCLNLT